MENKKSNLSSFVAKLDAEILGDNEAVLLNGGFSSPSDSETNIGCNVDNCTCTINECKGTDPIKKQ